MPETTEAYDFRGRTLIDRDGEKIGKIDELYYDEQGGQPEWALVNTALFGMKKTFVPIGSASPAGEQLKVAVSEEQVKDAPRIDADQELSESEERQLFDHYGVPYTTEGSTTAVGRVRLRKHVVPQNVQDEAVLHEQEPVIGAHGRKAAHVARAETAEDGREVSEEIRNPGADRASR
jgi:hypothetical protein